MYNSDWSIFIICYLHPHNPNGVLIVSVLLLGEYSWHKPINFNPKLIINMIQVAIIILRSILHDHMASNTLAYRLRNLYVYLIKSGCRTKFLSLSVLISSNLQSLVLLMATVNKSTVKYGA